MARRHLIWQMMRLLERPGRWMIILPPLLFLTVFFLIPFAFAFKISLAETASRVPPFTDILSHTPDGHLQLSVTFANFRYLLTDEVYGVAYQYSLKTAFFATLICLALGYPMAYAISRASKTTQSILLLVIILPARGRRHLLHRRGRPGNTGRHRPGPVRAVSGAAVIDRPGQRAAGDARDHYRHHAAVVVRFDAADVFVAAPGLYYAGDRACCIPRVAPRGPTRATHASHPTLAAPPPPYTSDHAPCG
jgi:hypothetical protein